MQRKFLSSLFILAFIFVYNLYGAQAEMESKILKMFIRVDPFDQFQLIGAKWTSLDEHYHFEGVDFRFTEAMVSKGKLFLAWEASSKNDNNIIFWSPFGSPSRNTHDVAVVLDNISLSEEGKFGVGTYSIDTIKEGEKQVGEIFEYDLPLGMPDEMFILECKLLVKQIYPEEGSYKEKTVLIPVHPTVEIPVTTKIPIPLPKLKSENYPIIVPESYEKDGVLPIYMAVPQDFSKMLDLKHFNKSEVIEKKEYTTYFADGGELRANFYGLRYEEYDGTRKVYHEGRHVNTLPRLNIANQVRRLAAQAFWDMTWREVPLLKWKEAHVRFPERESLENISLTQAKKLAEELLSIYHQGEYELHYALDMPLARIQSWGEELEKAIAALDETDSRKNLDLVEYQMATVEDEGYYLKYKKKDTSSIITNTIIAEFYITGKGIAYADIDEGYEIGTELRNSAQILAPEIIVKNLLEETVVHKRKTRNLQILSMHLVHKIGITKEGTAYVPAWSVVYVSDQTDGEIESAIFDACRGYWY